MNNSTGTPKEGAAILVVEDDTTLLNLLDQFLTQEGFEVTTATTGHQALERLKQPAATPDLILTDVSLPGMDGFSLLEKIRENKTKVPVIFMTGLGLDILERTGPLQPDAILKKPVRLAEIMEVIMQFLIVKD
jgi:two-component system OmpR family response regulator